MSVIFIHILLQECTKYMHRRFQTYRFQYSSPCEDASARLYKNHITYLYDSHIFLTLQIFTPTSSHIAPSMVLCMTVHALPYFNTHSHTESDYNRLSGRPYRISIHTPTQGVTGNSYKNQAICLHI